MTISTMIVRSGIGQWSNIAHIMMHGLDIGAPAVIGPDGGWGHLSKTQRKRLKHLGAEERQRTIDGWNQALREQAELRAQIIYSLHPEILGIPVSVEDDDEDDLEMLLMVH